jgi:hypothetical protein
MTLGFSKHELIFANSYTVYKYAIMFQNLLHQFCCDVNISLPVIILSLFHIHLSQVSRCAIDLTNQNITKPQLPVDALFMTQYLAGILINFTLIAETESCVL